MLRGLAIVPSRGLVFAWRDSFVVAATLLALLPIPRQNPALASKAPAPFRSAEEASSSMFRNPRENRALPRAARLAPSAGRPPSPPPAPPVAAPMASQSTSKKPIVKPKSTASQPSKTQTTLVPSNWGKKASAGNVSKSKPKAAPNGNIVAFFKKVEEQNSTIFLRERGAVPDSIPVAQEDDYVGWNGEARESAMIVTQDPEQRYHENGGSIKKRKLSTEAPIPGCTPPPPDTEGVEPPEALPAAVVDGLKTRRKTGPFVDESDSESDQEVPLRRGMEIRKDHQRGPAPSKISEESIPTGSPVPPLDRDRDRDRTLLGVGNGAEIGADEFDPFEGLEDEDSLEGEEYDERRWMEEQRRLEQAVANFDDDIDEDDAVVMFSEDTCKEGTTGHNSVSDAPSCPICGASLDALTEQEASVHVNGCLDGNPVPPLEPVRAGKNTTPNSAKHKMFKAQPRPARSGQQNPFKLGEHNATPKSAFSKLMANHAEDAAWATAAAAEVAARGKPSFQRTCPFYKILPGFYICVDAFRYGAVKGQNAYFLSHFHSDHYIGLTASWAHGPIYCSKVTANLVRQQLRVDPKWVVDLEFESKTEVPGTQGVHVTMIPANHCPGSSLFLFEKESGMGKNPRLQRVLHCGDFRACQAHIEHPLLRPEVMDAVSGKNRQQKLDVCYLDTTYLNPKYAFPPQNQVIRACADMCVSLCKEQVDETDGWEQMKRDRAGEGMVKFIRKASDTQQGQDNEELAGLAQNTKSDTSKRRGRLLVVVGTYSIGKERMCLGIAKALGSKIYAPPSKQRICRALEDPELDALLTSDPREAQVHMTPLFEIRAETLDDYLRDYSDHFSRAVGFRPSGWNYRPPKSRFIESPSIQTVLHSDNWKSQFSMRDLTQQRGSTHRAKCFGVPYSEHSSFRELTMFCCALRIDKIIPTVNVGNAKAREKMKAWCEKWTQEKKKNGLFKLQADGSGW